MMYKSEGQKYTPNPVLERALDILFILHADHEQNCSTSTVRMVGSSNANLFATISAGICALWGPLHGGANQAVLEMLEAIQKDGGDADKYMAKAKDKGRYFRIPADNRDLNYAQFYVEGDLKLSAVDDYTSHNTEQLEVDGVKNLLLKLDFIQEQLNA